MISQIYEAESKAIKEIAENGSCVIVGRCADKVLEDINPCLRIFLHADLPYRCKRAIEICGIKKERIEEFIKSIDKQWERYYKLFHDSKWDSALNYDCCFNTEKLSAEQIIAEIAKLFSELERGIKE